MIGATVHQNKKYTTILPHIVAETYRRITRRYWGVRLLITGGEVPVTYPLVLIEIRTPPVSRR